MLVWTIFCRNISTEYLLLQCHHYHQLIKKIYKWLIQFIVNGSHRFYEWHYVIGTLKNTLYGSTMGQESTFSLLLFH